jgi:hypothetical protein
MNLNAELGHALGMPPSCRKLVLTLEAGQVPRIVYECNVIERIPPEISGPAVDPVRIRQLQFMVRLEPFPGA